MAVVDEQSPAKGADRRWSIGGYDFELYRRSTAARWGVSAGGRGVLGYRTPVGALLAHVRHVGVPLYRLPGYGRAYAAAQTSLHRHGRCVLTRRLDPDARAYWSCQWCGNRAAP